MADICYCGHDLGDHMATPEMPCGHDDCRCTAYEEDDR